MWSFKSINIFMYVCCIRFVKVQEMCNQPYVIPNWEPHGSEPPANVKLKAVRESPEAATDLIQILEAQIEDVRENFTLSLFANPFIKSGRCPPANTKYLDLRKFYMSYTVVKGDGYSEPILFDKIFTGCYYVEMTNGEGRQWMQDPVFYETSYQYYDTMLTCKKFEFKPADYQRSMQLKYDIEIPLACLRLQCQLFELNQETNNTGDDLDSGEITPTRECSVIKNSNGMLPHVKCRSYSDKRSTFSATAEAAEKGDGRWRALITWDHLKDGGASYYTSFTLYTNACDRSDDDLRKWEPVVMLGAFSHGFKNVTNAVYRTEKIAYFQSPIFRITFYTLLGVTVAVITVYWMAKCIKILLRKKHTGDNVFVKPPDVVQIHDKKESNHILLIYARDSPSFITTMTSLRNCLQQMCHLPIHDLYSTDEIGIIMQLGAIGWVEGLLRDGCKVVWVDTPHFRSVLRDYKVDKDQQKQHEAGDFRDEAVPYAVALTTDLFQNPTTQYCRHFVVRLEGFQPDEEKDDPLLVVSPHTRYYIPEHLSLLCGHL